MQEMKPSDAKFCHPYQPYDIQLEFMNTLYQCIEDGKVGIFESPTGTGKSLSLICGGLTWLRDHKRRLYDEPIGETDPTDWLAQAENKARRRELLLQREELEQKLARLRRLEDRPKGESTSSTFVKKPRLATQQQKSSGLNIDQFVLDDYESDEDQNGSQRNVNTGISSKTQALLDQLKLPVKSEDELLQTDETKILFCSRTHSQLSQFINELKRVTPPRSIPTDTASLSKIPSSNEHVKQLALGSRKNLCINSKVSKLSATSSINERCLELQKPDTPKEQRCRYLPTKENSEVTEKFRDRAVARIRDIEDLRSVGNDMGICPYYASRGAIDLSEVLTLPYPLLLQKSAREALGVSIKSNVVIIDEAHNLMDAIADTFAVSIKLSQLELASAQVMEYIQRFKNRLKGKNRMYVTQVVRLLNSIIDCLKTLQSKCMSHDVAVTAAEFMAGKGVDQIKPHRLLQYLLESKLGHKVESYTQAVANAEAPNRSGLFMQFQNFLVVLMNPEGEGRFFATREDNDMVVRYVLLDPREHFRDIVSQARAVILAGGTMSPMSDYAQYLFSYLAPTQLQTFSFGHVIPTTNLFAQAIVAGPLNEQFDFTFVRRKSESLMFELGRSIHKICHIVPDGVVVFFPSYDYLAQVIATWKGGKASQSILTLLNEQKQVFEESKGVSVDDLLRDYARAIDSGKGGLMLSVIGGKLSEGINFSDRLGRAVIVVGLPFPNMHSAEWQAKLDHIVESCYNQYRKAGQMNEEQARSDAKASSRDFYENACMRAVNQSIGRAIRHKSDYAAIILMDRRYATDRISKKLPAWIRGSMRTDRNVMTWTELEQGLRSFFSDKL